MNRRTLLLGLGSTAAGTAAVLGTGAFSAAQVRGRDVDIAVTNDSDALIGLVPNPEVAGVHDDGGELTIDLDETGINQNSTYQFGFFESDDGIGLDNSNFPYTKSDPSETDSGFDSAFLIANQTSNEQTLEIEFELTTEDSSGDSFDTSFWFEAHNDGRKGLINGATDGMETAIITLDPGDACGVSFLLDVPGDTLGESISGSLAITAGEAVDGNVGGEQEQG